LKPPVEDTELVTERECQLHAAYLNIVHYGHKNVSPAVVPVK
jgi:hypothetical protein